MSIDERTEAATETTAAPESSASPSRTRAARIWSVVDRVAWISIVVGAVAVAVAVQVFGFQITRVLSPSMVPTFNPGDLVIIRPVTTTELQVGDIPMLPDADDPKAQYVHRIIQTSARGSEVWVVTQGDANEAPDTPKTIVSEKVPVVVASLPLSKVPTIALSWNMAMVLLGVTIIVFLGALFIPSKDSQEGGDEPGAPQKD